MSLIRPLLLTALVLGAVPARAESPNVLLILSDDQGWGDFRAHGNDKLDTPNLDRLAGQGARFDRFYVNPLCAPTRASLLTGRYHLRAGVHGVTRAAETMRDEEVTLAQVLKAAGYATGCFGKWHNGAHYPQHPNGKGFDEFLGFCGGHWNNYFDTTLERNGAPVKTKGYITDVLTDAALDFIDKHRARPFFCYVPYNAPHGPFQVSDALFNKYKARGFDDRTACVYAMCENLDANVGRLLARLDDRKLADRTIVLFLTDNGPNGDRFNGGMKGRKGSAHEGGVRVPLFVRWPGHIKAGTEVKAIAAHLDVLPTLVELCGVARPKTLPLDGRSLAPLLKGEAEAWKDERMLFTHLGKEPERGGAVRTQRWRAVGRDGAWELYDMAADPGQTKNVAAQRWDVVARLSKAFAESHKDVAKAGFDPIPAQVGHPQRPLVTLPGHEAFLHPESAKVAGISYVAPQGWANDWVTNWTSVAAYPWWEVEVVRPGRYEVTLRYTCPEAEVGSTVRVDVGGKSVEGVIQKAHDPKPLPSPDRVPRGEVYEKEWAPLTLGTVELDKGKTKLAVKAVRIAGKRVGDFKAVQLRYAD